MPQNGGDCVWPGDGLGVAMMVFVSIANSYEVPEMKKLSLAGAVLVIGCVPQFALAAPVTDSMTISVTVEVSCAVTVSDMTFSPITTRDTEADETATATATVACTADAPYEIGFDTGANEAVNGTAPARLFNSTVDIDNPYLTYGLYQDDEHEDLWGTSIGVNTVGGTGTGDDEIYTVYGQIDAGQEVSLGSYSDTVVASVWYGGDLS